MLARLLPLLLVLTSISLPAQCPVPGFAQVIEYQRAARVLVDDIGENVDSLLLYLGDESFLQFSPDDALAVYSFDREGPITGINIYDLEPGRRYNLFAVPICAGQQGTPSARQGFGTEAEGPPPNDSRSESGILGGAIVRCIGQPGTTRNATGPDVADDACGGAADDDVWYSLRAIFPRYDIEVFPLSGTDEDVILQVFDPQGQLLDCVDEGGIGESEFYALSNVEIDATYDFRVFTKTPNTYAVFEICNAGYPAEPVAVELGCNAAPVITFDGSGTPGQLVDVLDTSGAIIVSMENTQPLGEVAVSYFRSEDPVRLSDSSQARYSGRNVSIVPAQQPAEPVIVRFYLSDGEVNALIAAGAISEVGELDVTKVPAAVCSEVFPGNGEAVDFIGAGVYGTGYYVDVRLASFSEFYFHPAAESLISTSAIADNDRASEPWTFGPNPVGNRLLLLAPDALIDQAVQATVYTAGGARLTSITLAPGARRELVTAGWKPGVYFLVLTARSRSVTLRIVK